MVNVVEISPLHSELKDMCFTVNVVEIIPLSSELGDMCFTMFRVAVAFSSYTIDFSLAQ